MKIAGSRSDTLSRRQIGFPGRRDEHISGLAAFLLSLQAPGAIRWEAGRCDLP